MVVSRRERQGHASLLQRLLRAGRCWHVPGHAACGQAGEERQQNGAAGGGPGRPEDYLRLQRVSVAQGEGDPGWPRHSVGTAPSGDCRPQAGSWEAVLGFSLSRSHPLCSLAVSSSEREWVGAGNQIGISESRGSVLTVCLLLTVMVGHRGVPLRN